MINHVPPSWLPPEGLNGRPEWLDLDKVVVRPIVFAYEPFLQRGRFHLITGAKNAGKTSWMCWVAARVSRGTFGPNRGVLWLSLREDSFEMDIVPRLQVAGADLSVIKGLSRLSLPEDASELTLKAGELGGVGLIAIDPLVGAMASRNPNTEEVRPSLDILNDVARETDAIVLGTRHITNKTGGQQTGALSAVLGSSDWTNIPRAVLVVVADDVDPNRRHVFVTSANRTAGGQQPGETFRMVGVPVEVGEPIVRMELVGESDKDPDELLAKKRERSGRSAEARTLILRLLFASDDHQMESNLLDQEVIRETGLAEKTIRNLRTEMKQDDLLRFEPQERRPDGTVVRWIVRLTNTAIVGELERPQPLPPPSASRAHARAYTERERGISYLQGKTTSPSSASSPTSPLPWAGGEVENRTASNEPPAPFAAPQPTQLPLTDEWWEANGLGSFAPPRVNDQEGDRHDG